MVSPQYHGKACHTQPLARGFPLILYSLSGLKNKRSMARFLHRAGRVRLSRNAARTPYRRVIDKNHPNVV